MGNYIAEHRDELSIRHYIRKAGTEFYWFDFSYNKFHEYQEQYGNDFCLVIYGSENEDDAYIMPYKDLQEFFSLDSLESNRARWIGNIKDDVVHLSGGKSISVAAYYNAFDLLGIEEIDEHFKALREEPILYEIGDEIDKSSLIAKIRAFNEQYQYVAPYKRRVVSEQVARPGAITDHLKGLLDHTCQICGEQGFFQANGVRYIEAHHITALHKLIPGSYCSDNIVVVCANCHRKLHRAKVSYALISEVIVEVMINGQAYTFTRTPLAPK